MEAKQTTPEGTEFTITGGRIVFPTPGHQCGGGVAIPTDVVSELLAFPDSGEDTESQLTWEYTGDTEETRVGESKVIRLEQTSFGKTRTTEKTLVDIADADVQA